MYKNADFTYFNGNVNETRKGNFEAYDGNTLHYYIISWLDYCNLYSYEINGIQADVADEHV